MASFLTDLDCSSNPRERIICLSKESAPKHREKTALKSREEMPYASCYCEENVFQLVKLLSESEGLEDTYVVFLSSVTQCFPLWMQVGAYLYIKGLLLNVWLITKSWSRYYSLYHST